MAGVSENFDVCRPSGRRVPGVLTRHNGPAVGTMVMLHGLLSEKNHNFAPALAYMVACKLRLNVYRFDFRNGSDAAEPDYRYRFNGFAEDVDDCRCVSAALEAHGLGPIRFVFGHSRGANVAIMLCAQWPTVSSLPRPIPIAVSPRFHMAGMLGKFDAEAISRVTAEDQPIDAKFVWETKLGPIQITKGDIQEVRSMSMSPYLHSLPPGHPLLLVHGTADVTIPYQDSLDMLATRGAEQGTEFHGVEGANHTYQRSKHSEFLLRLVCNFLSRHVPQEGLVPGVDYGIAKGGATPREKKETSTPRADMKGKDKGAEASRAGFAPPRATVTLGCSVETLQSLIATEACRSHNAQQLTWLVYQLSCGWL